MRILFFINGIHPGGKERRMIELMKELKLRKGIDFELALMNREINYPEILKMDIKLHYLIRKSKKDLSIFRKFYKLCKEFRPDIIHCWDSMTAVYAIPACKLLNIKLMNGMVVDTPVIKNITNKNWLRARLTFPFSDVIVGNSKAGMKAYKAPLKKGLIIHNGYNFKRNEQLLDNKIIREQLDIHTEYIIGMVATFSEYKDYTTYYQAAKLLLTKRQDITFLAIGNNTDSPSSQQLAGNNLKEHFRLLGEKSGIESYINAMDICVLATFTEGISNSIMEYMALGKPVIATSGGGTNEIVEDGKTGILIKPSDAEILANKMELLLNNPELCLKMGISGKKRIQNYFSIDAMVNAFISYYEKLIGSPDLNATMLHEYSKKIKLES